MRDALGFHRTATSDVQITLSGLPLGTISRGAFLKLITHLMEFRDSDLKLEVFSDSIKLPSMQEQQRIEVISALPPLNKIEI